MKLTTLYCQFPGRKTYDQILRIMKFTAIFLLAACLQVHAHSYAQKITINEKKVSLQKVFKEINHQTGYQFFYKDALLNQAGKLNIEVKDASIEEVLRLCFQNLPISFSIVDKTIIIKPKEKIIEKPTIAVTIPVPDETPLAINVAGTVTDEKGNLLSGVSVMVKGTKQGTTTDANGRFLLNLPDGKQILVFSFIGFKQMEIPVNNQTDLKIVLSEVTNEMDQVVVVGYGTQIRKNLSSSISVVDMKKLNTTSANSFEAALQGQAAGVQVIQSSALGGSSVNIRIRGTSSVVGSSEPLYVIDGIPVESGEISQPNPGAQVKNYNLQMSSSTNVLASINPSDIQSIEVLKDASAAAIYGSRGANGVVLITTKKGKAGKTKISASAVFGMSEATHRPTLLNADQYIELSQEAWVNSGNNIDDYWTKSGVLKDGLTKEQAQQTNTDWIDQTLQTGVLQDYNISMSGGSNNTSFYLSGFLKDESTILKGNTYRRFGSRLNLEHKLNKIFTIGTKMSLSHVDDSPVPTAWAGGTGGVTDMLPIWPIYKDDGSFFNIIYTHPVAANAYHKINLTSNQVFGNWYMNAKIMNGLNFRSDYGVNLLTNDDFKYVDGRFLGTRRANSASIIGNRFSWNWNNSLNYIKRFNNHNLDFLVATEAQKFTQKVNTTIGDGFINTTLQYPQDAITKTLTYTQTGYSFLSYIGRINYDYKGKYLFSTSMRADASSRFGVNNRWGYFPSASVGYLISDEEYFKPLTNTFNFLKLRVSYGFVGNAGIGNNTYSTNYSTILYNGATGLNLDNLGDDKLGWEKTAQLDIGITFEALKGRISGEIDYYSKLTSNLLLRFPVSQLTGVSDVTKNVGALSNKGIDVMIKSQNIKTKNFSWETSLNFNHNENKVTKLLPGIEDGLVTYDLFSASALKIGSPVGMAPMVIWTGVDPATGEDTYLEKSTQKILTYSEIIASYGNFNTFTQTNQEFRGNPWPKYTGGFTNNFNWKNWNISALFTFSVGQEFALGDQHRYEAPFGASKINPPAYTMDRWQQPGDITSVAKLTTRDINYAASTQQLHRTDYLRFKDLTMGYTFNSKNKLALNGLRCYVRFTNLLTFTKAPDDYWDPEFSGGNYNNTGAIGYDKMAPQAKFYMFGISYEF